jgi:hypothetical protein
MQNYDEYGILVCTTTGTTCTDTGASNYHSLESYNGATFPGYCYYPYDRYLIRAKNTGLVTLSSFVYYIGYYDANACWSH